MINDRDSLEGLKSLLHDKFTSKIMPVCELIADELEIELAADGFYRNIKLLHDQAQFMFEQLTDITVVDWPQRSPRFCVVYHLLSFSMHNRLRIKVWVDDGQALPSIIDLWPAANWYEREAWDMYGIPFENHPDLRRILTDYGFEGHPQRKDFPLTGHVEMRYDLASGKCIYEPVSLNQDFRSFDFESPWQGLTKKHAEEALLQADQALADASRDSNRDEGKK